MSYYDSQQNPQQWSGASQSTWDQQTPPARSGANSAVPREDPAAFASQFDEVDKAIDNLMKSGKMLGGLSGGRRDSMPMPMPMPGATRSFPEQFDPRMGGGASGPPRHPSVSDFGGSDTRSFSGSNVQGFYANQRQHQPSRGANEAEQMMQAKRRQAAQRERELRNYHQEQQFHRSAVAEASTFGTSTRQDRTMSPGSGMSEEERRELITRQRNALYGEGTSFSENDTGNPRPGTQGSGSQSATGFRGHSPLTFDHFKSQGNQYDGPNQQTMNEPQSATAQGSGQQRSRANSPPPSPGQTSSFANLFDPAPQQSTRTSTSSPGGSPPRNGGKAQVGGVAPIGTRPSSQAPNPTLNKRSTTPLPSPLSYGFSAANSDEGQASKENNNGSSSLSHPSNAQQQSQQDAGLGWSSKSGVWGKNSLGVQASVWG